MKFTYTYRTSDGRRHAAEIDASSRDEAFARVRREFGVKPIRMVAAGGDAADGAFHGMSKRMLVVSASIVATIGVAAYWLGIRSADGNVAVINTPQGRVTRRHAEPLPRQAIPGNRERIDNDRQSLFTDAAECYLSRFAEPGRVVPAPVGARPNVDDFRAILHRPILVSSNELTEHIDLKRIVTGMKREMQAYIAGGGSIEGYLVELEKRQRLEASYRENAETKLNGTLSTPKEAYAYWLKANARLQAMGIYPLALPDSLRDYQMGLGIEE